MTNWERDTVDISGEDTPPLRVKRLARPAGVAPLLWTAHGFDHANANYAPQRQDGRADTPSTP